MGLAAMACGCDPTVVETQVRGKWPWSGQALWLGIKPAFGECWVQCSLP